MSTEATTLPELLAYQGKVYRLVHDLDKSPDEAGCRNCAFKRKHTADVYTCIRLAREQFPVSDEIDYYECWGRSGYVEAPDLSLDDVTALQVLHRLEGLDKPDE